MLHSIFKHPYTPNHFYNNYLSPASLTFIFLPKITISMGGFRSKSCRERKNQMEIYSGGGAGTQSVPSGMQDLRSYSISYASSSSYSAGPHLQPPYMGTHELKISKGKSSGGGTSYLKALSFNNPELQRKKRVAGYKVYSVEGKVKGSIRKSFKWIKDTYTQVVYGWW